MLGQPPGAPCPGYPPPGGGEGVVGKGGRVADQPWGQRPGWAGPGSDDAPHSLSPTQDCPRRRAVILKFSLQGLKIYSGEGEVGALGGRGVQVRTPRVSCSPGTHLRPALRPPEFLSLPWAVGHPLSKGPPPSFSPPHPTPCLQP